MCDSCGCSNNKQFSILIPETHNHSHHHDHDDHTHGKKIDLNKDVLSENNLYAEKNRKNLKDKNIIATNFVSSPGAGKTSLLEATILALKDEIKFYVIEGDQQTSNDADRINHTGAKVIQINTGNGCHLDAHMVGHAIFELNPENNSKLFIENVGNLVCPALFDLGETSRIVIMSVTEGEDKPLKYPNIFSSSNICIISKIDLLPYVDFNIENAMKYAKQVNPDLRFFMLSVKTKEGFEDWINFIRTM